MCIQNLANWQNIANIPATHRSGATMSRITSSGRLPRRGISGSTAKPLDTAKVYGAFLRRL